MENYGNPVVHLVTNILSNFSGNWVCTDSKGKLVSPLISQLPPITFLHEDFFTSASCIFHYCFSEIYLESKQQKECSKLQWFFLIYKNYVCTLSCSSWFVLEIVATWLAPENVPLGIAKEKCCTEFEVLKLLYSLF